LTILTDWSIIFERGENVQRGPKKKFDREEVLERAMEVFWEVGYEAAGLSRLLSAMGIGRQSMYDTFGDKRSLFLEALSHYVSTELAPIRRQLQADGSGLDNIYAVMEMWRASLGPGSLAAPRRLSADDGGRFLRSSGAGQTRRRAGTQRPRTGSGADDG
jgi:AcrR family transcriptional regulator